MTHSTAKVTLITGGSAGLGRAIAAAFAARGDRIALVARDSQRLEAAADELRSKGSEVTTFAGDVTRQEDVDRIVHAVSEKFDRLDVLVNNAGKSTRGAILDTTPEAFQTLWELNFLAAVRCTRAAATMLLEGHGSVVFIGSLASKVAAPYLGEYAATKFPLAAYAQQLRLETAERGLHTLLVCPGPIEREDAGERYAEAAAGLPDAAKKPGGGVKLRRLAPELVARRIVQACEARQPELVLPGKARLLFALSDLWPTLGDWLLRKQLRG